MGKRYFTDSDKLGRKKYADFLRNIIDNSEKYERDKLQESYVIAVDSSWGTGKTYFTDMFENYLLGFDGSDIQNENKDYAIIRFDAWKNDFWDNAFEPFAATVFENDMLYCEVEARNAGSFIKDLLSSSVTIAKGIAKKKMEDVIDSDSLEKAIDISTNSVGKFLLHDSTLFSEYKEFKDAISDFKESLEGIVSNQRKIVIIIDELDRCKPTFAVQLLEIVKHLFDIKGITFIFMLDIEQLSYSIKTIYGQEMDATGYLCRFFDYITRMPKPSVLTYIENSIEGVELFEKCSSEDNKNFIDFFCDLCQHFILSLRDIDTIICSYKIMLDTFLYEYPYIEAHCQYLFYLTLKYKDVAEFNNIFLKEQISKSIQKLDFEDFPCIKESIGNITTIIEDLQYKIITEQSQEGVRDQEGEVYRIASVDNDTIKLRRFNGVNSGYTIEISLDTRLNQLLFAPDIKKWEEIKHMKYGQYIHQQLEMFNFIEMES